MRPKAGARFNEVKDAIEQLLLTRREAIQAEVLTRKLELEKLDVTLPGRNGSSGGLHPVTRTLERCEPELAADLVDNGIVLAGGGALLQNMDTVIANANLQLHHIAACRRANQARADVVILLVDTADVARILDVVESDQQRVDRR